MLRKRQLTPAEARAFFEVGFVIIPAVFAAAEVAEMAAGFDRLLALAADLDGDVMHHGANFVVAQVPDASGRRRAVVRRIGWCGAAEPVLARYGADPRLLALAAPLLGTTEMQQLINQAHFKLPGDDVKFPWHQDSTHRGYGGPHWRDVNGRGSYVQTVIAIDASTPENGPLLFLPGSCRRGHLALKYSDREETVLEGLDVAEAVPALLAPGDVALFGPYTVHGSTPNRSAQPRRVFINGYACPGANSRVYRGEGAGRLLRAPATG